MRESKVSAWIDRGWSESTETVGRQAGSSYTTDLIERCYQSHRLSPPLAQSATYEAQPSNLSPSPRLQPRQQTAERYHSARCLQHASRAGKATLATARLCRHPTAAILASPTESVLMHRPSVQAARVAVEKARTTEFRELVQHHTQLNHRKRKLEDNTTDTNSTSPSSQLQLDATAASLLPPIIPPSAFTQSALLIRQSIADVHRLLLSQQRDYLDPHRHLTSVQSQMTDADRDTLEQTVARSITAIARQLDTLKEATAPPPPSLSALLDAALSSQPLQSAEVHAGSVWVHRGEVVLSLYDELKRVTEWMARMKDERRRQKQEEAETMHPASFRQFGAAAADGKEERKEASMAGMGKGKEEKKEEVKQNSQTDGAVATTNQWARLAQQNEHSPAPTATTPTLTSAARPTTHLETDDASSSSSAVADAPPVFSQQLEQENAQLFSSLSTHLSQLQQAESTASSISHLLTLFHTRVLEQSEQIERIEGNVVDSVALVERGVEQLRKAASRGASFRMMVMFMILLLSFCLLFLDWYYP